MHSSQAGRQRERLTKRNVDALEPRAIRYVAWDSDIPGFGVEVLPTGRKAFRLIYRPKGSPRMRNMTLGRFGSITVEEARKLARIALGDVAAGRDPAAIHIEARRQGTLAEAFERWLIEHVAAKRKGGTRDAYRLLWDVHIKKALGHRPLAEVSRADVASLHRNLSGSPYSANRSIAVVRAFFNWAERQELRPANSNPARLIELYPEKPRVRLITPDELGRLGAALADEEAMDTRDLERHWAVAAIRLLLFTGARRSEIQNLLWEHVDIDAGTAQLPDSKTGRKTLYLSAPARDVLLSIRRLPNNPHVIPGRKPGAKLVGLPKIWERVRKRAGLDDLRMHDLRHGFASAAAMGGMSLPTIGRLLGHSQPSQTDRYAHFASSPLVDAADSVATTIAEHLNGGRIKRG